MNSRATDNNQVYEYHMPHEEYRELLLRSCIPTPQRQGLSEEIVEIAQLTVFAASMLALLGYGLMWILR